MTLGHFISTNRQEIIGRCRNNVAARANPFPIDAESDHGIPLFLDQLMEALARPGARDLNVNFDISSTALHYGHDLRLQGFTLAQVVHVYGDVCQAITEMAMESDAPISTADFRTLNRCLDDAIAGAVTEHGRGNDEASAEAATDRGHEKMGFLAHELRNLVNTAIIAFEVLKTGNVGVAGSTGSVLQRSLLGLRSLVGRSLAEVRVTEGLQNHESIRLSSFVEELGAAAALEARAHGLSLVALPIEDGVFIEGDRQVLGAVIGNLLQNAFKFTKRNTTVILRAHATAQRVLIEIEDECGGLPGESAEDLFRPFEQRSTDRSGLGLGLAFSRMGVEANHGRIYARNLPLRGCVFTVDLPRLAVPVIAVV